MAVYTQDLCVFEVEDVAAYLDAFGGSVPEEYKPLWPSSGVFVAAIKSMINTRKRLVREASEARAWEDYKAQCERERLEEMSDPQEFERMLNEAAERLGLERKREIVTTPETQACPHCQGKLPIAPNIRMWSPKELRDLADVMERNEAISAANREANKIKAAEHLRSQIELSNAEAAL